MAQKNLLHPPRFSMKSSSSSSSSSSPKLSSSKFKNVLQTFFISHLYRISRSFTKAKTHVLEVVKNIHVIQVVEFSMKKNKINKNKLFLGSFRMHYNWCSSHVVPVMESLSKDGNWSCDSSWNSTLMMSSNDSFQQHDDHHHHEDDAKLSSYLHWLEGKATTAIASVSTAVISDDGDETETGMNDIDQLADMFIADSHEKFRLEKVESYRRFQEMLARSV